MRLSYRDQHSETLSCADRRHGPSAGAEWITRSCRRFLTGDPGPGVLVGANAVEPLARCHVNKGVAVEGE